MSRFKSRDHLEESLYEALMILVRQFKETGDKKFQKELREINAALVNYHNTAECGGGLNHDWGWAKACDGCSAPDEDCQNLDTIWCPTCLGCKEE